MSNAEFLGRTQPLLTAVNGLCPNCGAKAVGGQLLCGCRDRTATLKDLARKSQTLLPAVIARPQVSTPKDVVEFSTHFSLKEKQEYYQYGGRPWRFKVAPELNPELARALVSERLDKTYRFVWGGIVIVREEPNSPTFTIARGDRNAGQPNNGVFMPKYIFARATQARGFCYTDDLNRKIPVLREEFIPPGRLSRVDYRYVDFGKLFWFLEQRTRAADLLKAGVYNPKENVPEEEWICLMPLETKAGKYYEPGMEMIEILQKREWENRNANLKDVARLLMQRGEKERLKKEHKEDIAAKKDFDQLYEDVRKDVEKQSTYFIQ